MITCDTFNGETLTKHPLGLNRNRVSLSSLHTLEKANLQSPTYSIKYVLNGTEHYLLNGRHMRVGANRYLVVNSDRPFDTYIKSSRKVTGLCLHLEKNYVHDIYRQLTQTEEQLLDQPMEPIHALELQELISSDAETELGHYLQALVPKLHIKSQALLVEEESFFYELAHRLLQTKNVRRHHAPQLHVQKSSTHQELVQRLAVAKELLESHLDTSVDIKWVAQQCSLSPAHLFRCFRQMYGSSPHQYRLSYKLKHAVQMLRSGKLSATEAAAYYGFADLASFSKAFKRWCGVSPGRINNRS